LAFSYWFDQPWFHNWGKLAAVLIKHSSWGSQLGALTSHHHIPIHTHVHNMGSFEQNIPWFGSWPSSFSLNAMELRTW
jgi:hypothetical protein